MDLEAARLVQQRGEQRAADPVSLVLGTHVDGVLAREAEAAARLVGGEVPEARHRQIRDVRDQCDQAVGSVLGQPGAALLLAPGVDVPGGDALQDLAVVDRVDRGQVRLRGGSEREVVDRHGASVPQRADPEAAPRV